MREFGLFSDEGCVEAGFFTREDATAAMQARYQTAGLEVAEVCPDHEGERRLNCESCEAETDD